MQDLPSFLNRVAGGVPLKLPLLHWSSEASPKDLRAMLWEHRRWKKRKYHSKIQVWLAQNPPALSWLYEIQKKDWETLRKTSFHDKINLPVIMSSLLPQRETTSWRGQVRHCCTESFPDIACNSIDCEWSGNKPFSLNFPGLMLTLKMPLD